MKTIFFVFAMIFNMNVHSQVELRKDNLFVRVYNLQGEKISKGKLQAVTDTSLQNKGRKELVNLEYRSIGFIKTRRSTGNNVLTGALIGASALAIYGVASANPDATFFGYTAGEGAVIGAALGIPIGAAAGGITALFKNSKSHSIEGDLLKWQIFQEKIKTNIEF